MLDDKINHILEKCRFNNFNDKKWIFSKTLWIKFHWKGENIKLRILAKKIIDEIKILKEVAENNKDKLLDDLLEGENKIFKLFRVIKLK